MTALGPHDWAPVSPTRSGLGRKRAGPTKTEKGARGSGTAAAPCFIPRIIIAVDRGVRRERKENLSPSPAIAEDACKSAVKPGRAGFGA